MKLELKHLAPYLPYGLKVQTSLNEVYILEGLNRENAYLVGLTYAADIFSIKPILRPMSDYEKIENDFDLSTDFDSTYVASNEDLACINTGNATYLSDMLQVTAFLFANHFDVFGLIPAGLAIDINTLKP